MFSIILMSEVSTFNFWPRILKAMSIESPSFSVSVTVASLLMTPRRPSFLAESRCLLSSMLIAVPSGRMIFLAVCSLIVRVPVLSEAITVQLPSDSAAFNLRTMTFFLAILLAAMVRAVVRASGRPSGITETARAMTERRTSWVGAPLTIRRTATRAATMPTMTLIWRESFSTRRVSGDLVSSVSFKDSAILPISVLAPMV